ncbi:MAG: hypothetical protein KDJ99_27535, partial [Candidatus Competibacteraceae bacterium]|nr:hypothetical protein [Candidatus Competibacteraceae bacterium]
QLGTSPLGRGTRSITKDIRIFYRQHIKLQLLKYFISYPTLIICWTKYLKGAMNDQILNSAISTLEQAEFLHKEAMRSHAYTLQRLRSLREELEQVAVQDDGGDVYAVPDARSSQESSKD